MQTSWYSTNKCRLACNPELCDKILNDPDLNDLVWSDEFNVDGLPDPSKWGYDLGDGCPSLCNWGNNEQAYFTKLPSNVQRGYWLPFEINWEQDRIQFAVDKQIYFEYTKEGASDKCPFDQDFHLIMVGRKESMKQIPSEDLKTSFTGGPLSTLPPITKTEGIVI